MAKDDRVGDAQSFANTPLDDRAERLFVAKDTLQNLDSLPISATDILSLQLHPAVTCTSQALAKGTPTETLRFWIRPSPLGSCALINIVGSRSARG